MSQLTLKKGKNRKENPKSQCRIIFLVTRFILGLQKRKSHILENNLANIGWPPDWFLFWQPYINMVSEGIIDNNDKIRRCRLVSLKPSTIQETASAQSSTWIHFQTLPFHCWVTLSKVISLLCTSPSPLVSWRTAILTFPGKQLGD